MNTLYDYVYKCQEVNSTIFPENTKHVAQCILMATPFSDWLQAELNSRDWSQSDLGRMAGLGRGSVSNLINNVRKPGPEICQAIARALGYPPEIVYRAAGILPASPASNPKLEEAMFLLSQITPDEQDQAIAIIKYFFEKGMDERKQQNQQRLSSKSDTP